MKKTIAPAMTVLATELKTNMQNLLNDVGEIPQQVYQEAVNNGLRPAGPQYWIYEWESQDPTADFNLKICIPVATFGNNYAGTKFKLEQIAPFNHLSEIHHGPWENMKETYGMILEEIQSTKLVPGKVSRELYINCDFENGENNITEIQFGIN